MHRSDGCHVALPLASAIMIRGSSFTSLLAIPAVDGLLSSHNEMLRKIRD